MNDENRSEAMDEHPNSADPIERLQADLRGRLALATRDNPKARFTKRGRLAALVTAVAVVAAPAAAIALQGEEDNPYEPFTPAPAPLCIDNPDLPECVGTIAPSPEGTPEELQPTLCPDPPEESDLPCFERIKEGDEG